jgi:hypothetical protein
VVTVGLDEARKPGHVWLTSVSSAWGWMSPTIADIVLVGVLGVYPPGARPDAQDAPPVYSRARPFDTAIPMRGRP